MKLPQYFYLRQFHFFLRKLHYLINKIKKFIVIFISKRHKKFMETLSDLINSSVLVLIDIYADWCAPCKAMAPVLKQLKEKQGDAIRIIKINIDKNPQFASQYAINSVPTLMIFKSGKQLWRQSGAMSLNELNTSVGMFK